MNKKIQNSSVNTIRFLKKFKAHKDQRYLNMLTCYDYQTAQLLNDSEVDMILVGDSLGNVILGYDHTVSVSLEEMIIFGKAVRKGAPDKFVILDMPFGTYSTFNSAIKNSIKAFQSTGVNALKMEGSFESLNLVIQRLAEIGIPVMGHIGLTPQSVHHQGGYYTHGKMNEEKIILKDQSVKLIKSGIFSLVLECIEENLAQEITRQSSVPTIGIGSGPSVDGQVLVINDLFHLGPNTPPKFCEPILNIHQMKKEGLKNYFNVLQNKHKQHFSSKRGVKK
jgi:3-methyl-2-oxobutanoate hydroxymethyltransferase